VNGDGYADVIVGAPLYDNGQNDEGAAFVYLGNAHTSATETGRSVLAPQRRGDASGTPVAPWGRAWSETSFEVEMTATHPQGRGRVKLEVEACPESAAFGDLACTTQLGPSWVDVTATSGGVVLSETLTGLTADTLYRWRARVLHAPFTVTEAGITPPPSPAHGPWRRLTGQAVEADLRTLPEPSTAFGLAAGLGLLALLRRFRRS
jgi:hypothetical protein